MSTVDYYDVQGMIRDTRSEIRGDIDRVVQTEREARREHDDAIREGVNELRRTLDDISERLDNLEARTGLL